MRLGRIISLVLGCLLVVPAIGILIGGGALGAAYLVERDDNGYFDDNLDPLRSETAAITVEDLDFLSDPGSPGWVFDALDVDIRLRATGAAAADELFIAIGPEADVDRYLAGAAHDEIVEMDGDTPEYRTRAGDVTDLAPPAEQDFWVTSAVGPGTQQIVWEAEEGRWAAVLMNADASPGINADVNVGAKSGVVAPLAITMLAIGAFLTAAAVGLIVAGARGAGQASQPLAPQPLAPQPMAPQPMAPQTMAPQPMAPQTMAPQTMASQPEPVTPADAVTPVAPASAGEVVAGPHPVSLNAMLDPELSRWMWLVKWFLAIPHFIVLAFLWIAFVVLTVVAGFAILFTGRYPRGIFDFNVGVMRWSWRVQFYAANGGVGSDKYPPFSLHAEPGDHASLDVAYPEELSRPLVLVKWLLALPHLIIVGLLAGSTLRWFGDGNLGLDLLGGGGVLGLLVFVAGVILLVTNEYPRSLFDLIVGFNRWIYRVSAYVALMTDEYPPFRLDQGGAEPTGVAPDQGPGPQQPPPPAPIDLTEMSDTELPTVPV